MPSVVGGEDGRSRSLTFLFRYRDIILNSLLCQFISICCRERKSILHAQSFRFYASLKSFQILWYQTFFIGHFTLERSLPKIISTFPSISNIYISQRIAIGFLDGLKNKKPTTYRIWHNTMHDDDMILLYLLYAVCYAQRKSPFIVT